MGKGEFVQWRKGEIEIGDHYINIYLYISEHITFELSVTRGNVKDAIHLSHEFRVLSGDIHL